MLRRLRAQSLRGYSQPQLDIKFNADLNIVTGRNGSGKTTLLKLLWYLISGNIHNALLETPFSLVSLETDLYSMTVDLTSQDQPVITVDLDGKEVVFRAKSVEERDQDDFLDEEEDTIQKADSFIEDFGSSLFFPTFRRVEGGYSIPREARLPVNMSAALRRQRRGRTQLEEGMGEIATRLSNVRHNFICSVSTNDIVGLVVNKYNLVNERYSSAQQQLSSDIIQQIRDFETTGEPDSSAITASEVLDRIRRAIEAVDSGRVDMMSSLEAVQRVVVDLFDHRGISFSNRYLFGERAQSVLSEHLSAGEKQMLSFICYNAFYDESVLFIDEPELSLHVDWQRQLFPILEAQSTTNQFIVATHSPFIYSKFPEKELVLSPDRGE